MAAFALERVLAQYPEHGLQTVRSLAALRSEASVAVLLAALADPELGLVEELEQALRRLTNQELSGLEAWQRWYAEHGEGSIEEWWAAGFAAQGVELAAMPRREQVRALIELQLRAGAELALNAHEQLMEMVEYWSDPGAPVAKRVERWERWWGYNAWRL
jgi:hypothetical protein